MAYFCQLYVTNYPGQSTQSITYYEWDVNASLPTFTNIKSL